jgi:hypothetical protein
VLVRTARIRIVVSSTVYYCADVIKRLPLHGSHEVREIIPAGAQVLETYERSAGARSGLVRPPLVIVDFPIDPADIALLNNTVPCAPQESEARELLDPFADLRFSPSFRIFGAQLSEEFSQFLERRLIVLRHLSPRFKPPRY